MNRYGMSPLTGERYLRPSNVRQVAWLLGLVGACFAAAALGSAFTASSVDGWYQTLAKPSFNPPDSVFAPVWTTLYFLMAIAAWLAWRRVGTTGVRTPLIIFGVQLALNVAWSAVFFGLRSPGAALFVIVTLWCAIVATIVAMGRISRVSALLLAPYLAWVTFASVLNFQVWRLN